MTEKRSSSPWFGYGPAENPTSVTDIAFDVVGDFGYGFINDETWMDVIAEDLFDSSLPRQKHGSQTGANRKCQCFLCLAWAAEARRRRLKIIEALPLEDPRHPIHRKGSKLG